MFCNTIIKVSAATLYKIEILFRFQWSEAIYKFLPSIPTQYIHHFTSTKDYIGDEKITITSYDLLNRAVDIFEKHIYGFVILVCINNSTVCTNSVVLQIDKEYRYLFYKS